MIGVIATVIFLACFAMVAVTLHLTPEMDRLAKGRWSMLFSTLNQAQANFVHVLALPLQSHTSV